MLKKTLYFCLLSGLTGCSWSGTRVFTVERPANTSYAVAMEVVNRVLLDRGYSRSTMCGWGDLFLHTYVRGFDETGTIRPTVDVYGDRSQGKVYMKFIQRLRTIESEPTWSYVIGLRNEIRERVDVNWLDEKKRDRPADRVYWLLWKSRGANCIRGGS